MTALVRDWASVNYYAVLGVQPEASDEEISRAFRALAKCLHPDRFGDDSAEAERFKLVTAAYEVLSDKRLRADYDTIERSRHDALGVRTKPPSPMGTAPRIPDPPMIRWTPLKAVAAVVFGIVFTLAGIATAIVMIGLHVSESSASDGRISTRALIAQDPDGNDRLLFTTPDGIHLDVPMPKQTSPGQSTSSESGASNSATVLYRRTNPNDVILDESHFGRDITLWFVAIKLLFGGPIVAFVGRRRWRSLHRPNL